ncbi:hypothetical protein [Pseudoduganella sp. RAF53_2]|uniref:hypothetical protein n=1 Tax=unclassified Pseudoduganella TaxID=2637179 RepID=UPI003F9850CD
MPNALDWLVTTKSSQMSSVFAIADALQQMINAYPAAGASTNWQWLSAVLDGSSTNPNVANAVSASVLAQAAIEYKALNKLLGSALPAAVKPLVQSTAQLAQEAGVDWPLFDLENGAAPGAWQYGLETKSHCTVTAYPQTESSLGFKIPAEHVGLGIALHGDASVDLGAKGAFSWGSVSAGASAGASAILEAFSTPENDKPLAWALADLLKGVPTPGKLESLFDKGSGQARPQSIQALHMKVDGTLTATGTVKVGTTFVQNSAANVQMASLGVDIGLSAKFQHDRGYNLRVVLDGGKAQVDLTCSRANSKELGAGLDAGLSISGYANKLSQAMQEAFPSAKPLIEKLGPLSDIQGWLHDKLAEDLDGAAENAVADLVLAGSPAARKTQVLALLNQALSDAWQKVGIDFSVLNTADLEATVMDGVRGALDAKNNPKIEQAIKTHLQPAVANLFKNLKKQVKNEVDRVKKDVKAALGKDVSALLAPLDEALKPVDDLIKDLQADINKLDAPLLEWLNAYEQKRSMLVKAITQIAASQLKLSLGSEIATTHEEVSLLSVTFIHYSYAGDALYRGLWRGDLSALPELMERAASEQAILPGYTGWLVDTMVRQKTYRFSLDFFGLGSISATRVGLSQVAIKEDLRTHRILACTNVNSLNDRLLEFGKSQEGNMGLTLDAFATSGNGVPLTLSFTETGKKIDKDDVQMYFKTMMDARLVDATVGDRAWKLLQASAGQQNNVLTNAMLRTQLQLTGDEWRKLLHLKSSDVYDATCAVVLDVASAAWAINIPGHQLSQPILELSTHFPDADLLKPTGLVRWCARNHGTVIGEIQDALGPLTTVWKTAYINTFLRIGMLGTGFGAGIDVLQGLSSTLAALADDPSQINKAALQSQLSQCNTALLKAWDSAAGTSLPAFFTPLRFPWPTLAFYAALALAVGRPRDRIGLINMVSPTGTEQDAVLVV